MARFKNTISGLEARLRQQQRQVEALEAEQQALRLKEAGLLSTLATLQCGASAIAAAADQQQPPDMGGKPQQHQANNRPSQQCSVASVQQQLLSLQQLLQTPVSENVRAPLPSSTVMQVLHSMSADPGRVLSYLALTVEERLQWLAGAVRQLGLLLPKFENQLPKYRTELETITQEIMARGLTYTLVDAEFSTVVQLQLVNMESGEVEPGYPAGFTTHVAQSLELLPQQKLSLQALYSRLKAEQKHLLAQHDALLQQVDQLHRHQHHEQQLFAARAQQLPIRAAAGCSAWAASNGGSGSSRPLTPQQQHQQPKQQQSGGLECTQLAGPAGIKVEQQQEQQQQLWCAAGYGTATTTAANPTISSSSPSLDSQQATLDVMGLRDSVSQQQQQQEQRQQEQQHHQGSAGAPGLPASSSGTAPAAAVPKQQQQHISVLFEPPLADDPATTVLLPPSSADQRRLEAQLSAIRGRLALHEKLLDCHVFNILTPKQLAALVVSSWPFCPDISALCAAYEELGW